MAANPPPVERRAACMLCLGRVDPGHYTCRECCRRLWQGIADGLQSDACT